MNKEARTVMALMITNILIEVVSEGTPGFEERIFSVLNGMQHCR
jgi:hypothetical protein